MTAARIIEEITVEADRITVSLSEYRRLLAVERAARNYVLIKWPGPQSVTMAGPLLDRAETQLRDALEAPR